LEEFCQTVNVSFVEKTEKKLFEKWIMKFADPNLEGFSVFSPVHKAHPLLTVALFGFLIFSENDWRAKRIFHVCVTHMKSESYLFGSQRFCRM
jgi:hypothetical protein